MGNITVSVTDRTESSIRRMAKEKFEGRKGALGKVIDEAIEKIEKEDERLEARKQMLKMMEKGFDMGKILYKERGELYER